MSTRKIVASVISPPKRERGYLLNHFEPFGLQQVFARPRNRAMTEAQVRTPLLGERYRIYRQHVGMLIPRRKSPRPHVGNTALGRLTAQNHHDDAGRDPFNSDRALPDRLPAHCVGCGTLNAHGLQITSHVKLTGSFASGSGHMRGIVLSSFQDESNCGKLSGEIHSRSCVHGKATSS